MCRRQKPADPRPGDQEGRKDEVQPEGGPPLRHGGRPRGPGVPEEAGLQVAFKLLFYPHNFVCLFKHESIRIMRKIQHSKAFLFTQSCLSF